jgi:hypothetical protein
MYVDSVGNKLGSQLGLGLVVTAYIFSDGLEVAGKALIPMPPIPMK